MTIYRNKTNGFEIKQNDTSPRLETVLLDGDGTPIDLTAAMSVKLSMRACEHPKTVALNKVAASYNATTAGEVWYQWQAADTDTVGKYEIEWTVEFPGGIILTVPSKGFDTVEVTKRI